ncbi:hypothetical protein GF380_01845, partial [Candidatus Uhrbacteria bacterium]|nr:hypothetical protein [Candidatus Uhrbacteria bacterium]
MIITTDRYFQARLAGAKPLCLAYIGTNYGLRCFGKQMPTPEQVGTTLPNIIESGAYVLSFGEYRQAASQNSEDVTQALQETVMDSCTLMFDNASGLFTEIACREKFINGELYLFQGFDYPGFIFSDFIRIFYGRIQTYKYGKLTFQCTANQAVETDADTEGQTIDLTVTYT